MKQNKSVNVDSEFNFKSQLIHAQVEDEALVQKNHRIIIDTATKLFAKEGFHNTTIRQIVKHSGIGIGSIYQYVNNKEEILVLILEYILKQYEFRLTRALVFDDTPRKRLRIGIETYYRIVDREHDKVTIAYSSMISLSRPYREYIKELELKTNAIFEQLLIDGIKAEVYEPVNTKLVTYNIIMTAHMWALKRWYFRDIMTIDEYIEQQMAFFGKMIVKE